MKASLENILMPVDYNESSENASNYSFDIAPGTEGKLHLPVVPETKGVINDFLQSGKQIVKILDKAKSRLIVFAAKLSSQYGIDVETRPERGEINQKILEVREELDARIIILGENHPFSSGLSTFFGMKKKCISLSRFN